MAHVVIDVDGTLVDASTHVSSVDAAAARRLAAAGGTLHLATGRNEFAASRITAQLETTPPAILYNGARLVDLGTGKVWWESQLEPTAHDSLLDLLLVGALGAEPVIYSDGAVLALTRSKAIDELAERDGTPIEVVDRPEALRGRPVVKWILITAPPLVKAVDACVRDACAGQVRTTYSEPGYVEVLPEGVDKGTGLERLAEVCGYELERTVAVGDKPNDLPMLRRAGVPVAVTSAHPDLLSVAVRTVPDPPHGSLAELVDLILTGHLLPPDSRRVARERDSL